MHDPASGPQWSSEAPIHPMVDRTLDPAQVCVVETAVAGMAWDECRNGEIGVQSRQVGGEVDGGQVSQLDHQSEEIEGWQADEGMRWAG